MQRGPLFVLRVAAGKGAQAIALWGAVGLMLLGIGFAQAGDLVTLWVEPVTVPPSAQPPMNVQVKNVTRGSYEGMLGMKTPEGWQIAPAQRPVSLQPGETKRVAFNVEKRLTLQNNSYAVEVVAVGGGSTVVRKQDVFCASAPYFKPVIDGDPGDWKEAIPIAFTTAGKKTTLSTFWNRQKFSLLVAVEEDRLVPYRDPLPGTGCDAIQLAVSAQDSLGSSSPDDTAGRFEFLLVAAGEGGQGKCFRLAQPATKLSVAAQPRPLAPLEYAEAQVAVTRKGGVTFYECALPFAPMRDRIRPSEGREFFLSVLVHDPDGTGIRDLGEAAGLGPERRNARAWSRWRGAHWPSQPPCDNQIPWGLCTSKY